MAGAGCSTATGAQAADIWQTTRAQKGDALLFAPRDDSLANGHVRDEQLVVKRRVGERRRILLFETLLDVGAV